MASLGPVDSQRVERHHQHEDDQVPQSTGVSCRLAGVFERLDVGACVPKVRKQAEVEQGREGVTQFRIFAEFAADGDLPAQQHGCAEGRHHRDKRCKGE